MTSSKNERQFLATSHQVCGKTRISFAPLSTRSACRGRIYGKPFHLLEPRPRGSSAGTYKLASPHNSRMQGISDEICGLFQRKASKCDELMLSSTLGITQPEHASYKPWRRSLVTQPNSTIWPLSTRTQSGLRLRPRHLLQLLFRERQRKRSGDFASGHIPSPGKGLCGFLCGKLVNAYKYVNIFREDSTANCCRIRSGNGLG